MSAPVDPPWAGREPLTPAPELLARWCRIDACTNKSEGHALETFADAHTLPEDRAGFGPWYVVEGTVAPEPVRPVTDGTAQ